LEGIISENCLRFSAANIKITPNNLAKEVSEGGGPEFIMHNKEFKNKRTQQNRQGTKEHQNNQLFYSQ
jgi:hypothetical protein